MAPELAQARKPIEALRQSLPHLPTTMVLSERRPEHARATHVHKRGEFLKLGEVVEPGVPEVLHPLPPGSRPDRLAFARWLVDERNPLVGRVVLNRIWQTFFGRGIVSTTEDFGTQGACPTHPELLDWLETEFIRQGWSMKAMSRLIVTSTTYRQSSRASAPLLARDPRNELLARGPRFRVPAEAVRDIALACGGLLTEAVGGPSVHPPQPDGVTSLAYDTAPWPTSTGANRYRRGLYTFFKRTSPYAAFITMDAPTSATVCVRRERSNTPLQALALLNDTVFVEAARALAARIVRECPQAGDESRICHAFRLCLAQPLPRRTGSAQGVPRPSARPAYVGALDASRIAGQVPGQAPPTPLFAAAVDTPELNELAAWTTLARVILNLDETVTKE